MKKYGAKDLARWGSCKEGIALAEELAPNGATVMEMLYMDKVPNDFIHWVKDRIAFTEEEKTAYLSRMNIINSTNLYYSEQVKDSNFIVKSKKISNSDNVFSSKNIENSKNVVESEDVENSTKIFHSTFIIDSFQVDHCSNITEGNNLYKSFGIIKSSNVFESTDIFNSSEIVRSENISNSRFCFECKNLSNCLFCYGLTDCEFYIFNKPVSKEKFEIFSKQYTKYWNGELKFIQEWPSDLVRSLFLKPNLNISKWFVEVSTKFWKWTETLPGYDSMFLYEMTMIPEILID